MPRTIADYVLRYTGRHQLGLVALSIAVFLLSAVPLELQRRIINAIVEHGNFTTVLWLAAAYAGVALAEQSLKLALNVYRGWVAEDAVRTLRTAIGEGAEAAGSADSAVDTGTEIAMLLEEVEPIGGFTGISVSEPVLQGGILVSVVGYMLFLDGALALLGLAFFVPQLVFVPLLQGAINRRAQSRILTKRGMGGGVIEAAGTVGRGWGWSRAPIQRVFRLNMGIYKLKFTMNLLMNLMHHFSVAAALGFGGWLVLQGRIEIGTVVAIVGGLGKLNDPWGDLVNWFRELSVVGVKYRLFADAVDRLAGGNLPQQVGPSQPAMGSAT
jgi:ABC-type bacteriocin/lantibiotic exporter with double-glycine peptidase domain